ncbi:MAG: Rrf2 family transcriptional regulator [Rickettsiales bacterium]|nr:Rrf2 family transcriptional regulator [Rickettsiales bacterium]
MILSTKGRYAVMAMVELALSDGKPMSLANIAEKQDMPLAYLEQIFAKLKKAGLVISSRGPGGGYRLADEPARIYISKVVFAAEESIEMTRCAKAQTGCVKQGTRCLTHDLWEGLTQQIEVYLAAISLEDICEGRVKGKVPNKVAAELQSHISA